MWPFIVLSCSPSSQSQIFIVQSSDPEAKDEWMGWNATDVTAFRCPCRLCRAGDRGNQAAGSWFRFDKDVGVALSISDCRVLFCDSSSNIYGRTVRAAWHACITVGEQTFFCNRTTLVHFFSRRPSYFFAVFASNTSSPRFASARSAAAAFGRLFARR